MSVAPSDAEIRVNGAPSQPRPGTRVHRVVSGRVLVEAVARGFQTGRSALTVPPGAHIDQSFELSPEPPARTVRAVVQSVPSERSVGGRPTPRRTGQLRTTIISGSLTAAGAALTLGVVAQIMRERAASRFDDDARCAFGGVSRAVRCAGDASDYNRYTNVTLASYVTAALSAGIGATLALTVPFTTVDIAVGRDAMIGGFSGRL